jgi:RNA polymerase sigma-70 factor (ECF subfamily)
MTVLTNPSDDDLLRRTAGGDEEAFASLYRRRQAGIYRFALHMSGCPSVAEEVTQEVFMTLIRDTSQYDAAKGSLSAYLYGIARKHVLKSFDRNRLYVALDEDMDATLIANTDSPLGDLTRNESIEAVRQAILTLPESYREVVVLCELEEMSYAEASIVLGIPIGTLRSRLSRGRALLVEKLKATAGATSGSVRIRSTGCFA